MNNSLTPAQALENLAQIAADYPLRVKDRNVINESIALLNTLVQAAAAPAGAVAAEVEAKRPR